LPSLELLLTFDGRKHWHRPDEMSRIIAREPVDALDAAAFVVGNGRRRDIRSSGKGRGPCF